MDGSLHDPSLSLQDRAAGLLMPMHLCISPSGQIRSAGPTLLKLFASDGLIGHRFRDLFELRRPGSMETAQEFAALAGQKLQLALRDPPRTAFVGIAVPLEAGQGTLLNLSFGVNVTDAVRDHRLTAADFAPTDLVVEMLFLAEAKTLVMGELTRRNQRLHGDKLAAEEQALTDAVTGLRNRRAMERALARMIETQAPFSLVSLDLDYFKQVNDRLGHAAGDHVLGRVARILTAEVRGSDLAARVGGDEFVLLFPGLVDPAKLSLLSHRILARLEEPIPFEGQMARISGSFGTVMVRADERQSAEAILANADRALYASKRQGRGRVTPFDASLEPPPAG